MFLFFFEGNLFFWFEQALFFFRGGGRHLSAEKRASSGSE